MYASYQSWFKDVGSTRGYEPVRIELGGTRENPTILTRQDWRGPRAGWDLNDLGFWEVVVARTGSFDIALHVTPRRFPTTVHVSLNGTNRQRALDAGATECEFKALPVKAGPARLEAWVEGNRARAGVLDATVVYRDR
jgi:hypothetical protein